MRAPPAFFRPRAFAGFTLLEILIVLVIIGVIISIATIATGVLGRDRDMQDQAERLNAILTQAKEECELQGFDVGVRVTDDGYDFLRFDSRKQLWNLISDDDFFAARRLPPGLKFRLWLEGREIILQSRTAGSKNEDSAEDVKQEPPQIMVLSSGDVNSFKLLFERDGTDTRWQVFSKPDSTLVVEQADETI